MLAGLLLLVCVTQAAEVTTDCDLAGLCVTQAAKEVTADCSCRLALYVSQVTAE